MILQRCKICGKHKPLDKFSLEGHGTQLRKKVCYACDSAKRLEDPKRQAYMREYQRKYRERKKVC